MKGMFAYLSRKTVTAQRTHKRIAMQIPMEIDGKDEHGHRFCSPAVTRNVSPDGGCLACKKDVIKGEVLQLVNSKGIHFAARVCWSAYNYRDDMRLVGFLLLARKHDWVLRSVKRGILEY
jgi:hypothetical protein